MKPSVWILFIISAIVCSNTCMAEKRVAYRYFEKNGSVSYSDRPKHDGYTKVVHTQSGWEDPSQSPNYQQNYQRYAPIITKISTEHQVSTKLVKAVIHAESLYNPHAVSSAGAVGLMQLMPATARRYGVTNRQNAKQNIDGGVRYLKDLLVMFDNNIDLALAAYNAGENAVKKYGRKIPPYKETQKYVIKVKALTHRYSN